MQFIVITEVPDPEKGDTGNLAVSLDIYLQTEQPNVENSYQGVVTNLPKQMGASALMLRVPVFALGELLICDDDGREMYGHMRKPDKWGIKFESFNDIHAALKRATELSD